MKHNYLKLALTTAISLALATTSFSSQSENKVFGGPANGVDPASGSWAWSGSYLGGFRGALEDPANFGFGSPSEHTITTVDLATIDASTLAGIDVFVSSWWRDGDSTIHQAAVIDWFLDGGELLLLQDDINHDGIGQALGIPTSPSDGSTSTGDEPIFEGPFGSADGSTQSYLVGQLSAADIAATGGSIAGTNEVGQVTVAYWCANDYAAGAGGMVIIADVDMISITPDPNRYNPLTANGSLALNSAAFLAEQCVITVLMDIKPDDYPNSINPKNKGVIPVAILTTDDFDALSVDASTLAFGPNGAGIAHGSSHAEDVDGDGDLDMMLHFKTQETGIVCGDTEATLTGATLDGTEISGVDTLETKGCK